MLSDLDICRKIGARLRAVRLRQNLTQASLAHQAQISLSSVKKIENGQIGSFDSLMRVLRMLGELDILTPLTKKLEMSPNEYLRFIEIMKRKERKRASRNQPPFPITNQESEW